MKHFKNKIASITGTAVAVVILLLGFDLIPNYQISGDFTLHHLCLLVILIALIWFLDGISPSNKKLKIPIQIAFTLLAVIALLIKII